jgi:hypothetical protein
VDIYITIGFSSEIGYFGSFSGHSAHEGGLINGNQRSKKMKKKGSIAMLVFFVLGAASTSLYAQTTEVEITPRCQAIPADSTVMAVVAVEYISPTELSLCRAAL